MYSARIARPRLFKLMAARPARRVVTSIVALCMLMLQFATLSYACERSNTSEAPAAVVAAMPCHQHMAPEAAPKPTAAGALCQEHCEAGAKLANTDSGLKIPDVTLLLVPSAFPPVVVQAEPVAVALQSTVPQHAESPPLSILLGNFRS